MINIARKKPVEVEVCQWTGKNWDEIKEFCGDVVYKHPLESIENVYGSIKVYDLMIHTLEGDHKANPGDYIIKGVHGEFYPCKPDIFEATYEEVKDSDI